MLFRCHVFSLRSDAFVCALSLLRWLTPTFGSPRPSRILSDPTKWSKFFGGKRSVSQECGEPASLHILVLCLVAPLARDHLSLLSRWLSLPAGPIPSAMASSSSHPPPLYDHRVPTTPPVSLPPGLQSPSAFDAVSSQAGFRALDCPRLHVDDAFASYREDDRDWMDAWRVQQSCPASRNDTIISHLFC